MKKSIISVGIDLSLTGTGVVILQDGKMLDQKLIKSKPVGDTVLYTKGKVCIVVIENLAFGVRNATSLTQLAALNYFTRKIFMEVEVPFVLVAPTSLKKFATSNGAAK